jgi:DNA primase catalytic core
VNIRDAIEEIKTNLVGYLKERGISVSERGAFPCPVSACRHKRGDAVPSAQISQDMKRVYCHTNHTSWDIFHIANQMEGLPIGHDPSFYTETVPELAKRYGITYDDIELTDDQRQRLSLFGVNKDAHRLIIDNAETVEAAITARGWTIDEAKEMGVGCAPSFKNFMEHLKSKGWTSAIIEQAGLSRPDLFNEHTMLFTVCDGKGRPVGFAGRDLLFDPSDPDHSTKYRNTSNVGLYDKSNLFFLLNKADKSNGPLYLFEGYTDAVTLSLRGLKNAVALGGTALSTNHIKMLDKMGLRDIIICYDGDESGDRALDSSLARIESTVPSMSRRILYMPRDMDPDTYVSTFGIDEFRKLPLVSAFQHRLSKEFPIASTYDIEEKIVPIIAAQPMPIARSDMIKDLCAHVGDSVSESDIREAIDIVMEKQDKEVLRKEQSILDRSIREAKRDGADVLIVLDNAQVEISSLRRNAEPGFDPIESFCTHIVAASNKFRERDPDDRGFAMPNFPALEKVFRGFPKYGSLITVGANSSIGKSSFARNICWEIACHNDDAQVLYMTIDDDRECAIKSIIASMAALSIFEVSAPAQLGVGSSRYKAWETAFAKLLERAKGHKNFMCFDSTSGRSVSTLRRHLEWAIEKFPNRKPVVFIDNFHVLDGAHDLQIRERTIENATELKRMCSKYQIPISIVVQMNKSQDLWRLPTPSDIQETVQVEYESDALIILHSDLQRNGASKKYWKTDIIDQGEVIETKMPFLEGQVWKNKTEGLFISNGEEGKLYWKLNRHYSRIDECSYEDVLLAVAAAGGKPMSIPMADPTENISDGR